MRFYVFVNISHFVLFINIRFHIRSDIYKSAYCFKIHTFMSSNSSVLILALTIRLYCSFML